MNKDKMYHCIDNLGLNAKETIAASEELDQEVLAEMLKDPIVENIYLKQVVKSKEYRIAKLEEIIRNLRRMNRRINDLAEVAVMLNETGVPAEDSVKLSVHISQVKGF
ncbi:hypothetical protein [Clostridium saudiense]|uniref:hypothetical protein n=1 Tax=Clostridium saudiense TaxID=1414720 RepID=UPI002672D5DD|nr:hypothetical protein [Clostridium saudiense]